MWSHTLMTGINIKDETLKVKIFVGRYHDFSRLGNCPLLIIHENEVAVAQLAAYKLSLLKGDWWEYPEDGFFVMEFMREERFSEANAGMFASHVTEFIRGVEGVFEVDDVKFETDGRVFRYSCQLLTEEGPAALEYAFD